MAKLRLKGRKQHKWREQKLKYYSKNLEKLVKERTWELKKEEEKLRSIFAASPDAIVLTDLKGNITEYNKAALEMYGTRLKRDLLGKNAIQLIAKKDRQRARKNLKRTLEQGSTKNIEYILLKKNGGEYPIELSASVVKDVLGNPTSFMAIIKEISDRKKAEEILTESERKYRSVVDNIGIGVAIISPKMQILALNKQMQKWFPEIATSQKPICYKSFNNPPRKNTCSYCPTCKTLNDGKTHEAVTSTPRGSKTVNFRIISSPITDKNGNVTAAIEMVDDITEQKRIEEEVERHSKNLEKLIKERTRKLSEEEERFRSVADYASEAIITINNQAHVIFWNKAAETIFGYPTEEAIGKSITFIMPTRIRKKYQKMIHKVLSTKNFNSADKTFELVGFRKNGNEFPIEFSLSVWKTREGTFSTGIIRDITERRRIEDERKHYEEMLSALNTCGGKLNKAQSFNEVYELTLDAMERTFGFGHAAFMIADNGKLRPVSQRGYNGLSGFELPLDGTKRGITVRAAVKCESILVPDVRKDKDYVRASSTQFGMSELAVPVVVENQVFGVLNVESEKLNVFRERDLMLLQILASHTATAISNLKKRDEIEKRGNQLASLMRSSAEMIHSTELRQRLQAILDAIQGLGWRRVVLSVRDENLDIIKPDDIVTAGLTEEEREFLWINRQSGQVWIERFGSDYAKFKIGEFYYLLWSDPFVRKRFSEGTVSSHLAPEEMVDWDPDDLLYAPLRLANGRIVGVVSIDDPVNGRRPTKESLAPLELFLHQAAVAIENARLIKQLNDAKTQVQEYAGHLEIKVEERTRELANAQNRLLKTERLAAIGELAGMVGHDLRNPLTSIAGAAYYLRIKYGLLMDGKGKEMVNIIEKDIEYSNKIVNDLLEYSRDVKLRLSRIDPKSMLNDALSSIKVPQNIQIIDLTQRKPKIKVDIERMQRVFVNIIKNAFDAMPNGGKLVIKSKKLRDSIALSFSDTGEGMSKETMNKLWTPLFTTKAKGMGFGLPICKRVIEAHGGKFSVESTAGQGSTFTVFIPLEPKMEEQNKIWVNVPEHLIPIVKN